MSKVIIKVQNTEKMKEAITHTEGLMTILNKWAEENEDKGKMHELLLEHQFPDLSLNVFDINDKLFN